MKSLSQLQKEFNETAVADEPSYDNYRIWEDIDVLDSVELWTEATVQRVNLREDSVYVHYDSWKNKWDEWIPRKSSRIARRGVNTFQGAGTLKVGQRISVRDEIGKWRESAVIKEREDAVLIHYCGWESKFDEWIPRTWTERFRKYFSTDYHVRAHPTALPPRRAVAPQLPEPKQIKSMLDNMAPKQLREMIDGGQRLHQFLKNNPGFNDTITKLMKTMNLDIDTDQILKDDPVFSDRMKKKMNYHPWVGKRIKIRYKGETAEGKIIKYSCDDKKHTILFDDKKKRRYDLSKSTRAIFSGSAKKTSDPDPYYNRYS